MPVYIEEVSFFSELQGVSDEPVDWLLANVGDKIRIETELNVKTYAISSNDNTIRLNCKSGFIGAGWVYDATGQFKDFKVGDNVSIDNYIAGSHTDSRTIVQKIDDNTIQLDANITGPADDEESTQVVISVLTPITALRYKWNFIENAESPNFFSKVSGTEQILLVKDADASNVTPKNMEFIGESSYQIGSATCEGVEIVVPDGSSGKEVYLSRFKVIHETFITPLMLALQRDDLVARTAPEYFFNTKCLKAVFDVEAMYNYSDPNRIQTIQITEVTGNTGWFNENFNTGLTNYLASPITYTDSASVAVDSLQLIDDDYTTFSLVIANGTDTPFVAGVTKAVINFSKLPEDESEYQLNGRTMSENFVLDRALLTCDAADINGEKYGTGYQVFKDVSLNFVSGIYIVVTGKVLLGASAYARLIESETPEYMLWVSIQEQGLTMATADKVSLLADADEFTINTTDEGLVSITNKFIRHPEENGCTDFPAAAIPAMATYDASAWAGGSASFNMTISLNFLIAGSNTRSVTLQSSINGAFAALVTLFNGLGFGVIATYNSGTKVFTLKNPTNIGAAGNGKLISSWTFAGGGAPTNITPSGAVFSGGVDATNDDLTVFPEDEVVAYSRFYVDKSAITTEEVVLTKITCKLKAKNSSTGDEFTLEQYISDVSNAIVVSDNQYFDLQQDRVFHLPSDEIRKTIRLYRRDDLDASDKFYYDVIYPFMVRWEYWKALAGSDSAFFDTGEPNNGWNHFWHRYTTETNWGLYYELDIRATKDGELQQYTYEQQITSKDYDSNSAWEPESVKTYDPDTSDELYDPISGRRYILGYKNTKVEARFASTTGTPDLDNITVVLGLEIFEEGGIDGRRRYSSRNPADSDTWFQAIDGDDLVKLELDGDVVVATALVDFSQLPSKSKFSISARIYDIVDVCT